MFQMEITTLLHLINQGNNDAWHMLMQQTYRDLLLIAHNQRQKLNLDMEHTLDTYALVHESYWSLFHSKQIKWNDRKHFYLTAAQAFRFIIANNQRRKNAQRRGQHAITFTTLEDAKMLAIPITEERAELLNDGLTALEKVHHQAYEVAMLRFFSGLMEYEIADILEVTLRTVGRYWRFGRAFLLEYIQKNEKSCFKP